MKILRVVPLFVVTLLLALPVSFSHANVEKVETRCGWFSNPTPANASLFDSQQEWIIGVQGGHQAEGDWPEFSAKQWVETNVHYGYGCACLRLTVNHETSEVIRIVSGSARPLSACRRDRALKKWDFK
ncbi:MAG TPA: DUF4087 domain-containing protein [Pyrinomonadaceae bacterium]|jgi:hypothetical protein|nr:DUF4087 domain-containing protein [Pyrinomonadaceae bacterium]